MNAKYVVALILALQVSMSLCEVPPPTQELIDKYNAMKAKFLQRVLTGYNKVQEAVGPMIEELGKSDRGAVAKTYVEDMQNRPELQAAVRVISGLHDEASPVVDKARTSLLGAYEYYLRPTIGNYLSDCIDYIKGYLDVAMPAE